MVGHPRTRVNSSADGPVVEVGDAHRPESGEEAYFQSRVLNPRQYEAMICLLTIFGQHLSLASNQLLVGNRPMQSRPRVARARKFIKDHQAESISLSTVVGVVNTSTFYFSQDVKQATGLHFTEAHLSRIRIEKAKMFLLNPERPRQRHCSYQAGFQSLTHFNRVLNA